MKHRKKRIPRWLLVATVVSFIGLAIFLGLHEYLYTFDPYSWANPKVESVESRNLFNERKDLYRVFILMFFTLTLLFGSATGIAWWRGRQAPGSI